MLFFVLFLYFAITIVAGIFLASGIAMLFVSGFSVGVLHKV